MTDEPAPAYPKSPLRSKTIWIQILAVLTVLIPSVRDWLAANPVEFVAALAALNTLVRFATKGGLQLFPHSDDTEMDPPGGTGVITVAGMGVAGALLMGALALPSCAHMDFDGRLFYLHPESGAQAGLVYDGKTPRGYITVPILDKDGNEIGKAEIGGAAKPKIINPSK
jgi:hypothetical protein